MRTTASDQAYRNPDNKERRKSQKELIYEFFKWDNEVAFIGSTYPEVADKLNIPKSNSQKRCSDLCKDGKLEVRGIRDGYSIYFEGDGKQKMTKPEAYKMAVSIYCNKDVKELINRFVESNT